MRIGAMNHPRLDVLEEIHALAALGFDFVDLTIEPPAAAHWRVDPARIRGALTELGLGAVGHTAYYLPIGSPFEEIRRAAVRELKATFEVFAKIGVRQVNVHPDRYAPQHERAFILDRDLQSLRELLDFARPLGLELMIENLPGDFNTAAQLADLLEPLPELGLHLDIGHANLLVKPNTSAEILRAHGRRLRHVHLHDNRGGSEDLHLPLGVGNIDFVEQIGLLKAAGYDGTITLEVFCPERRFLADSRDVLRKLWETTAAGAKGTRGQAAEVGTVASGE
ncbi:MAG: sugar phosphate isomerase/epimerase family protein [Planctomycetota bacterium]